MARFANANWNCGDGQCLSVDYAQLAVLMDIRDELQTLNRIFRCPNFLDIPAKLDRIDGNTRKPTRKRKPRAE